MPAPSAEDIGHGTLFQRGNSDGPPETFTSLGEVQESTPPSPARDAVDVSHTSTATRDRIFIPGMSDPGEAKITINYIPGSVTDDNIRADYASKVLRNYKILFPDGEYIIFNGFLQNYAPGVPMDDKKTMDLTYKVSGPITYS